MALVETILLSFGIVLAIGALLFAVGTARLPSACRSYGHAAVVACGAMAVAYFVMVPVENAGLVTDYVRFVGYGIVWAPVCLVVGAVAGAERRLTLALLAIVQARVWVTLVSWHVDGALGTVLTLVPFVALAAGVALLFGPFMRAARRVGGSRALLYGKLRNLVVLVWVGLVTVGLLSGAEIGLTDDIVSQFSTGYIELILLLGFGGIVVRSADALEATAATHRLLPFGSAPTDETVDPDPEPTVNSAD